MPQTIQFASLVGLALFHGDLLSYFYFAFSYVVIPAKSGRFPKSTSGINEIMLFSFFASFSPRNRSLSRKNRDRGHYGETASEETRTPVSVARARVPDFIDELDIVNVGTAHLLSLSPLRLERPGAVESDLAQSRGDAIR
jgi:hypothetical protein